jgi:TolB protein
VEVGSRRAETAPRWAAAGVAVALLLAAAPSGVAAQDDSLQVAEGIELGLLYGAAPPETVVVRPFLTAEASDAGLEGEAGRVEAIVVRDLELSDRFVVLRASELPSIPSADYVAWDALGADFVVNATIEAHPEGSRLRLGVYDLVYSLPVREATFPLPPSSSPTFRMAVHRMSDAVVAWIAQEPGMAASRIAYGRRREDGGYDVMMVDSDGEEVRRVARHDGLAFSPVWSPEGGAIAYTAMTDAAMYEVIGLTLADGTPRALAPPRELVMTPAWSSDGSRLAVAISEGRREDLYELDPGSGRLRLMARGAMEPSYAPDGGRLAFSSDRLGTSQVWIMGLQNGDPELISPWAVRDRNSYHAPDWSPALIPGDARPDPF